MRFSAPTLAAVYSSVRICGHLSLTPETLFEERKHLALGNAELEVQRPASLYGIRRKRSNGLWSTFHLAQVPL